MWEVYITQAVKNIYAAKIRSFLAVLGVFIGTSSVVALVLSGQLATQFVVDRFANLGTNLLSVTASPSFGDSGKSTKNIGFSLEKIKLLETYHKQIRDIAPVVFSHERAKYGYNYLPFRVVGSTANLSVLGKFKIAKGRRLSGVDSMQAVCMIGNKVAKELREDGVIYPLGKSISVSGHYFTIVGIGKPWPSNFFFMVDLDRAIIVPMQELFFLQTDLNIRDLILRFKPKANVIRQQHLIAANLHTWLPKMQLFFRNPQQLVDNIREEKQTFTLLLALIGSISLLVGGIGIMNIMLVSIEERKGEIGLRMAVGALQRDISFLFLFEAVVLSFFGGLMGVFFGILVTYVITLFTHWNFHIYLEPPLAGFFVSALVGVSFGYFPALQAARLQPIDALSKGF